MIVSWFYLSESGAVQTGAAVRSRLSATAAMLVDRTVSILVMPLLQV